MRKGLGCLIALAAAALTSAVSAVLLCGSTEAAVSSAPAYTQVPLNLPAAIRNANVVSGEFAPDGGLWLVAPVRGGRATFVKVNVMTGRILKSVRVGVIQQDQLTVGPDGNVWFGGLDSTRKHLEVGILAADGRVRQVRLPVCGSDAQVTSLVAGTDGAVWVGAQDCHLHLELLRVDPRGAVTAYPTGPAGAVSNWNSVLVPASGGGFWASALFESGTWLARVTQSGEIRQSGRAVNPLTRDGAGDVWTYGGWPDHLGFITPSGQFGSVSWWTLQQPLTPALGTAALGSDGRMWFTGEALYQSPLAHSVPAYSDPVLGAATVDGLSGTWPDPFVARDGSPVGHGNVDANELLPGPDGRMYAIGYEAPPGSFYKASGPWHLYAVTLPDHPKMHHTVLKLEAAAARWRDVRVRLGCTGQSGLYCAGWITVKRGSRVVGSESYAIAPGLGSSYSVPVSRQVARTRLSVSVSDRNPGLGSRRPVDTTIQVR